MTTGGGELSAVWNAVLFVFLGWLLGLLGPIVVDAIRRRRRDREVRGAILSELSEARLRLAGLVYIVQSRSGTYDRRLIEWLLPIVESYRGPNATKGLAELIRKQLALDDAQLAALAEIQRADVGTGLAVRKYKIPYIDSHLADLGIFDEQSRASILDIRSNFDLLSEEVDDVHFYHKLTYDAVLSDENHRRATASVEQCYQNLAARARTIIDRINQLLPVGGLSGRR